MPCLRPGRYAFEQAGCGLTDIILAMSRSDSDIICWCVNLRGGLQIATSTMPPVGLNTSQPFAGVKIGSVSCRAEKGECGQDERR